MMTIKELVEKLMVGGGKVQIEDESTLNASTHQVSRAIGTALEAVLPAAARIHHGVQVSALKRGAEWSGELEWLLLTDTEVVRLRGKIGKNSDGSTFTLDHQFHPVVGLMNVAVTMEHQEHAGSSHLRAASFEAVFASDTLKASGHYPDGNPGPAGVTRFARMLLDRRTDLQLGAAHTE